MGRISDQVQRYGPIGNELGAEAYVHHESHGHDFYDEVRYRIRKRLHARDREFHLLQEDVRDLLKSLRNDHIQGNAKALGSIVKCFLIRSRLL